MMNVYRAGRGPVAALLTCLLLSGCASQGTPPNRMPECHGSEALVCYGKRATRLGDRDRLEDVEFCHCEQVVF